MSSETPPENMSVGELREWLKNFGKKNEEHFRQGQIKRRSPKISSSIGNGGFSNVSNRRSVFEQRKKDTDEENNSQQENDRPGLAKKRVPPKLDVVHASGTIENNGPQVPSAEEHPFDEFPLKQDDSVDVSLNKPDQDLEKSIDAASNETFEEQESSELPEEPSLQDDLCLTLSAVSMISSFSMEAEASNVKPRVVEQGPTASQKLVMEESRQKVVQGSPTPPAKNRSVFRKPNDTKPGSLQQSLDKFSLKPKVHVHAPEPPSPQPKAVPAAWSDLEPIDFSDSNDEKDANSSDNSWQIWDNGDARQYLQRQTLPAFQGFWSDDECGEEDDDDSAATGLRSEPSRHFRNSRSRQSRRKGRRHSLSRLETTTIFEDEPAALLSDGLTLFGAAKDSMTGQKPMSRHTSFSSYVDHTSTGSFKAKRDGLALNRSMCNANLFQNKVLTAGALDMICNGTPSKEEHRHGSLGSFLERVDQESHCSWSEDSGKPSVAPNAVDANLSKVLSHDTDNTYPTIDSLSEKRQPTPPRLQPSHDVREEAPSPDKLKVQVVDVLPNEMTAKPEKSEKGSPTNSFTSVLQKFGGGGRRARRKSRVERHKEALEEQWQKTRKVKYEKKPKWEVGGPAGKYKRKLVLNPVEK